MDYQDYLETWVTGIKGEIEFWNDYISNEGGGSFYGFEKTVSPKRKFELEDDIPMEKYGQKFRFLDVGAGPFSRCGRVTTKVELEAISVDPLADAYNYIKEKYHVDNGVKLESGFVELLNRKYASNSFDMVHMSNALDHSFNAIDGIFQMIYICKIGGKIVLRHHENEAENEGYVGLHQWNLSLHNPENSFVIWRENQRFDVCEIFSDYVDFQLTADIREKDGYWIYNKVVMTKKKDISIPVNFYYETMLDVFYKHFLKLCLVDLKERQVSTDFDTRMKKIRKVYHQKQRSQDIMRKHGISKISIYGMGVIGKNLEYVLSKCGMIIENKFDQRGSESGCAGAIPLAECKKIDSDIIVISIENQEIIQQVRNYFDGTIYLIDDFLDLFC